jgi:HlyD family secretion protein
MKRLAIVGLIVALIVGGLGYYFYRQRTAAAQTATAAKVTEAKVQRTDLRTSVSATGRVVSNLDVEIKCKASGEVIKLPFDVSDVVKKGDLLVELDPVDENRAVAQAVASLEASQARLATAQQNLQIAEGNLRIATAKAQAALPAAQAREADARSKAQRMQQLMEKKLASQEDFDTAQTTAAQALTELRNAELAIENLKIEEMNLELRKQDIRLAQTQVQSDQLTLDNARQRLADTKVVAPIDGVVASRDVQIGQIISSGITNVGGGTTVMVISDLSRIFVTASVDESDIGRVKLNQDVLITADAFPERRFTGKVILIATKGVNNSNVVTFDVKIEVTGRQVALLKPEMTANVQIILDQRENVLAVPVGALERRERKYFVNVVDAAGQVREQEVEVGLSDGSLREIVSGLEEGQTVQVKPAQLDSRWVSSSNRGMRSPMGGRR